MKMDRRDFVKRSITTAALAGMSAKSYSRVIKGMLELAQKRLSAPKQE